LSVVNISIIWMNFNWFNHFFKTFLSCKSHISTFHVLYSGRNRSFSFGRKEAHHSFVLLSSLASEVHSSQHSKVKKEKKKPRTVKTETWTFFSHILLRFHILLRVRILSQSLIVPLIFGPTLSSKSTHITNFILMWTYISAQKEA